MGGSATSASPMIEDVAQELPLAGETARRIRQLTTKGICGDGRLSFSIASVSARFGDEERRVETNPRAARSEEHTSELQSLMRISYAVFCLKKKKDKKYD